MKIYLNPFNKTNLELIKKANKKYKLKKANKKYNIALCFTVRNCEKYLSSIFTNIKELKKLKFNIYSIFIYDNCSDNSSILLNNYKNINSNVIVRHIENNSQHRTVRIAKARNECLNIVYNDLKDIKYHIMIDTDNVNSYKWNIDIIDKYLNNFDNDNWDCISFNRNYYYDIWALLFDNFYHHCWGYKDHTTSTKVVNIMHNEIKHKLDNSLTNSIEVISAFNGFCIYKTDRFKDFVYSGLYKDIHKLISDKKREKTLKILKNKYNIDTIYSLSDIESCEHLFYNYSAYKKNRKIKISKFII